MGRLSSSQRKLLEKAASNYEMHLTQAATYLGSRGIPMETATLCRFGVVIDPEPGHEQMVSRLSIPYITRAGIVAFKFRCMHNHDCKAAGHAKYLAPLGQLRRLYNVEALFAPGDEIAITEGELDAVVLTMCGIPAVGVSGTDGWRPHFTRLFGGYQRVLMWADNDPPKDGRRAGERLAKTVAKELSQAVVIGLPEGQDVNSVYLTEGAEGLRRRAYGGTD